MDGHRDPVRRISKRRGSKGTKQPRAAVRTQAPVTPPWNPPRAVGYVVVGLILLFSIEAAMAETALITPINPLFLNLIRGVGLVLGLAGAAVTIANRGMPWAKKLVVIVVLPLLCAYVGGWVAWRIADRVEFGFSSGGFEPAIYPIVSANWGKRWLRAHIGINPFGNFESTDIPVSDALYRAIRPHYRDYCIVVMQRRSPSGAIAIRTDGLLTSREPAPVRLFRCAPAGR